MLTKSKYGINEEYDEDFSLVVGVRYGSEGIIACHKGCLGSCISSSGDSICGGYRGHEEVEVKGTPLYIVRCSTDIKCKVDD